MFNLQNSKVILRNSILKLNIRGLKLYSKGKYNFNDKCCTSVSTFLFFFLKFHLLNFTYVGN